jgi:hypothetical protein
MARLPVITGRVGQLFEPFLILQPDIVANSLQLQVFPGSSTDNPDVLDDQTWSDRRTSD